MFGLFSRFTDAPKVTPWDYVKKHLTPEECVLHEDEFLAKAFLSCVFPYTGRKIGVPLFGSNTMRESLWAALRGVALWDTIDEDGRVNHKSNRVSLYPIAAESAWRALQIREDQPDYQADNQIFLKYCKRKLALILIPVFQILAAFFLRPIVGEKEEALSVLDSKDTK